ncbi:hypothetical protein [Clostridium cochlearium]|uniref:hypothetical protein n=1 Tax=Clostridium cochlearium TaxID=1494 RepID=UPI00182491A0|nr:hypothetical protein [Clostridium cochlearium]NMA58700.1 hypothetical protein [Clostridium cochlearium]
MKDYMFCNYMKDCYMDSMCDEDSINRPLCNMCGLTPLCPPNYIMPMAKESKEDMACKDMSSASPMYMGENICGMQDNMWPGMHQGMHYGMCPMMGGCGGMYPMMPGYGMGPMMGGGCYGMHPMMGQCGEMEPMMYNREVDFEEFDLDEE